MLNAATQEIAESTMATDVKAIRRRLGMTQQRFASLLNVSFVSVNTWESGKVSPSGVGRIMLELLDNVLKVHPPHVITERLKACNGSTLDIIRQLTAMEREKKT